MACEHPYNELNVYGNPDPLEFVANGVPKRFKLDAECEKCGESVSVTYQLEGVRGKR